MRLYNFIEPKVITSINGSIISKDILNHIDKDFIFGCILEQCYAKNEKKKGYDENDIKKIKEIKVFKQKFLEKKRELEKLKKACETAKDCLQSEKYDVDMLNLDTEYEKKSKEYNDASEQKENILLQLGELHDDILKKLKEDNTEENNKSELATKLMEMKKKISDEKKSIRELDNDWEGFDIEYNKKKYSFSLSLPVSDSDVENHEKYEEIIEEEYNIKKKLVGSEEELWREILFFKVMEKRDNKELICEVSDMFYKENNKSGLKICDTLQINPKYISYILNDDCIVKKFNVQSYNSPTITNWNGCIYSDIEYIKNLVNVDWIVRVQLRETTTDDKCVWYMRILSRDNNILYGYSLDTYKIMDYEFDYNQSFKCNCIYKFDINSIIEIPNWQDEKTNELLRKFTTKKGFSVTGMKLGTNESEYIDVE
jgi:hypothetical protein